MNIGWIGSQFISRLADTTEKVEKEKLDDIFSMCFRFLFELYLSVKNDLSMEFERARRFAFTDLDQFHPNSRAQIEYAIREMPISILKSLLSSDQIKGLKDFGDTVRGAEQIKKEWDAELDQREGRVNNLKENLDQYESAFNFVGLHQGFAELGDAKRCEKNGILVWLVVFGILIILPFACEGYLIWTHLETLEKLKTALLVSVVPTLSVAGILVFYFRVLLHNFNAAKSQVLQIELRKTLCRFIQSYVLYAEKMKEKNSDSLSRFENIIFSGIVSSDEKLPSTFDGIEQLGNLIKSIKK
jgi:hypothetical protein